MAGNDNLDALNAMSSRIKKAKERFQDPLTQPNAEKAGKSSVLGLAFRVAVEIVSAVAIGFGLGWLLDDWLGSKPWLMVLFIIVGFAAGILNVYRMASGFGYAAGYNVRDKPVSTKSQVDEEN